MRKRHICHFILHLKQWLSISGALSTFPDQLQEITTQYSFFNTSPAQSQESTTQY